MKMLAPIEIGICCRNLDTLAAFYVEVLGCRWVNDLQVPADKAAPSALADDGYRVVRLQTPWGERLKLLQPARSAAAAGTAEPWILARHGVVYITFIVDNLKAMVAGLKSAGVAFMTGEEPVEVRPRTFLTFVRDPEGNVLEFVEYGDIAEYRPELADRS